MADQKHNWADDDEFDDPSALPPQQITSNPDGTKTIVTWRLNEDNKKVKTTRKIRTTIKKEYVDPRVAERREWAKFGNEKGHPAGPDLTTTSVGENIIFKPSTNWKATQKEESAEDQALREKLLQKKVACRICKGDHFTARCPFKDTLQPLDEAGAAAEADTGAGGAVDDSVDANGRYIAPHMRKGAGARAGDSMGGGKQERDDLATLRVTNVSEMAEEADLRAMFERYGRVTRVFLAKDRDTGRAKGFAFVSYQDRADAAKACEKMDGHGYGHLILRVEFAKRSQ
ncbi:translation initiation factor 3, RNA-binding subunit [Ascobolus immersus RN42]|uniref:Eukaryotic translation initiation factor 3 subunit G n=1 Tax=Ascobolus immersus RN42 TaxID=1160509 RepID=A0A3N4IBV3_ASCIM|nr:translation initiation factor 3, RNA-binding subunit [Ascobolus immersus RN42]